MKITKTTAKETLKEGEFYQNNKIKIIVGGEAQEKVITKFQQILDKAYNKIKDDKTDKIGRYQKSENEYINISKYEREALKRTSTLRTFGNDIDSSSAVQRMIGAAHIMFKNADALKIVTVSGDEALSSHQMLTKIESDDTKYEKGDVKPLIINERELFGYKFINIGAPKGKIMDLSSGEFTTAEYQTGCAAQKIVKYASDYIESLRKKGNYDVKVKEIVMRETFWIAPDVKNKCKFYSTMGAVPSCDLCKINLGYSTGVRPPQN